MAKKATSIFVGDSAIRALEAAGKRARRCATEPLEPGLVRDGVILNQAAVADRVRRLWRRNGLGARRVVAGISGINCLYRTLSLPELPRELLPEAVRREAARTLGVPVQQLYLSWQVVPSRSGETQVYLAAAPKNAVDSLIQTLRKAGLEPYLMDFRPLALARTTDQAQAIVLDVQPTSLDIVIKADGRPTVVRSISLPRDDPLTEKLPLVSDELGRAVTFYNSSQPDKPLQAEIPLLVAGELAEHEEYWEKLSAEQGRPVQALPSPLEPAENCPAHLFMTNIGLVLKELLGGRQAASYSLVDFNALPDVYRPKRTPIADLLFLPVVIAGVGLVGLAGYLNFTTAAQTPQLREDLETLNETIVSIVQEQQQEVKALEKEIASLENQATSAEATADSLRQTLEAFEAGDTEINTDLAKINEGLQIGGVDLDSVNEKPEQVSIDAMADTEEAMFDYASFLRGTARFDRVVITEVRRQQEGLRFSLTLTKRGPIAVEEAEEEPTPEA
jgi:type IV pilus assembly protein PilM